MHSRALPLDGHEATLADLAVVDGILGIPTDEHGGEGTRRGTAVPTVQRTRQ